MAALKPARKASRDPETPEAIAGEGDQPIVPRLLGELFGDQLLESGAAKWYFAQPVERRQLFLCLIGASLLIFPYLGAVGLWDPWETHFAEVGREMIARHDWIRPWWEKAPFYSKPPLLMWLTNLGLIFTGTSATELGVEMGHLAEWGVRVPVALLAIGAIGMLYLAASRLFGRRVGLLAALICATCPLYALIARQAITDTPFLALLTAGMCCFAIAEFDPQVKNRDPWLYAFYALIGLATLAKEIPFGAGIPGAIVLAFILLTWDWALLLRVRLFSGALLFAAIAVPWVFRMGLTTEPEEEGETFNHRYWLHDNFSRLLGGVHTTSPNATFAYYIEQLGFGMYPWSALLPASVMSLALDPKSRADRAKLFVGLWALVPFAVISLSATKFEHYDLPCFPPLAILTALFLDKIWREGLSRHSYALMWAGVLFAAIGQNLFNRPKVITEMFTYNPERPYPMNLIADPTPIWGTLVLLGAAVALIGLLTGGKGKAMVYGPVTLVIGFVVYLVTHVGAGVRWQPRDVFGNIFIFFAVLCGLAILRARREWFLAAFSGCAIAFAGYLSWVHWEQLTPHWTQRDLVALYYEHRLPGETLGAYLMNWKGETFYTKNQVRQMQDPNKLHDFLREPSGPNNRHWIVTDSRYYPQFAKQMQSEGHKLTVEMDSSQNAKFFLVTVE